MKLKYIVAWISEDKKQCDYAPFETKLEAQEFYSRLISDGYYSVSLCKILDSTDY